MTQLGYVVESVDNRGTRSPREQALVHAIYKQLGIVMFFFSGGRRHTRCGRDWSSDVCSSDLTTAVPDTRLSRAVVSMGGLIGPALLSTVIFALATKPRWARWVLGGFGVLCALSVILVVRKIGRASRRERG